MTLEVDVPRTPGPGHTEAGPPRTVFMADQGPAESAGKVTSLAEAGIPAVAIVKAHQLIIPTGHPTDLCGKTGAGQLPITRTALS